MKEGCTLCKSLKHLWLSKAYKVPLELLDTSDRYSPDRPRRPGWSGTDDTRVGSEAGDDEPEFYDGCRCSMVCRRVTLQAVRRMIGRRNPRKPRRNTVPEKAGIKAGTDQLVSLLAAFKINVL